MSENQITPEHSVEFFQHRGELQGERIKTGYRYPESIFLMNLGLADVQAIVRGVERIGEPTVEQWLGLRAGAAERRLRASGEVATGLARIWPQKLNPSGVTEISPERSGDHPLLDILVHLVGDRLVDRVFDTGTKPWRLEDRVAQIVLSINPIVARSATDSDQATILAARIAGSVRKRLFSSRTELGKDATTEDPGLTRALDHQLIENLADSFAAREDTGSVLMARFLRDAELWDLSREEQARALGVSAANWRQIFCRTTRPLRAMREYV